MLNKENVVRGIVLWKVLSTILYGQSKLNSILSTTEYHTALIARTDYMFCAGFFITFSLYPKGIDGISVYILQRMRKEVKLWTHLLLSISLEYNLML